MKIRLAGFVGAAGLLAFNVGCPFSGTDVVAGRTGDSARLGSNPQVRVFSPVTNLSISGGAPVEVNWSIVATTNFASVRIVFDVDDDPTNGNEIVSLQGLSTNETSALLDTSRLSAGTYRIGVLLIERNELASFAYAGGSLIVNQAPDLTFNSPRNSVAFDRSIETQPLFEVSWTVNDPDSVITTQIFLDPDSTPNGNEVLLRESTSQTGDSFTFNLPTLSFEPGEYRILAIVSDGVTETAFYAPGVIRLRARLSGFIDLRDLGLPGSPLRGAVFQGVHPRDNAGSFVGNVGDYDSDGFSDILLVSQFGKPQFQSNISRFGTGEAYLIYGRSTQFTGRIDLNSTGALFRGEVFQGIREAFNPIKPSRGITSVAVLSDWDRDTVRELAFGIPFVDSLPSQSNESYMDVGGYFRTGGVVVFAGYNLRPDLGFPGGNVVDLTEVGSTTHTTRRETPNCRLGHTYFGAGGKVPPSVQGLSVTWFYRWLSPTGAALITTVRQGCRISTNEVNDNCGESISRYQFDSIIISTPDRDSSIASLLLPVPSTPGAGTVSIYFTRRGGDAWPYDTINAPAAANGWPGVARPPGFLALPQEGPYMYSLDDYRIDGFTGRLMTPNYFTVPNDDDPCIITFNSDVPAAPNTMRLLGVDPGGRLTNAVGIQDFNGDGLEDILVGYPFYDNGRGACYVVYGRLRDLMAGAEITIDEFRLALNDENRARIFNGLQIVGEPGSRLGETQDLIGDFNGDGIPDIAMGSSLLNNRRGGCVVLFGGRGLINLDDREIPMRAIPERGLGLIIEGEFEGDLAGARVARAGDIDGDGIDDLLIAAPNKSVTLDINQDGRIDIDRTNCGVVYLIYGGAHLSGVLNLRDIGTDKLPGVAFVGRNSGDFLGAGEGSQGDVSVGMAAAGDVDGDGLQDLLMSSVRASPDNRVEAGEVYLLYGIGG